jgi:hypothetical protein
MVDGDGCRCPAAELEAGRAPRADEMSVRRADHVPAYSRSVGGGGCGVVAIVVFRQPSRGPGTRVVNGKSEYCHDSIILVRKESRSVINVSDSRSGENFKVFYYYITSG